MASGDKNVELLQGTPRSHHPARPVDDGAAHSYALATRLTCAGERALAKQSERWRRLAGLVDKLLLEH